jgi:hypothetical protein
LGAARAGPRQASSKRLGRAATSTVSNCYLQVTPGFGHSSSGSFAMLFTTRLASSRVIDLEISTSRRRGRIHRRAPVRWHSIILKPAPIASTVHGAGKRLIGRDYRKGASATKLQRSNSSSRRVKPRRSLPTRAICRARVWAGVGKGKAAARAATQCPAES